MLRLGLSSCIPQGLSDAIMKLLTKAELPKAIDSITKRGRILDTDIHQAACSAIAIKGEQGDTMFINRLYLALPKGTRAAALTAWLLQFGGVVANDGTTGKSKAEQPFLHTKDKLVDVEEGMKQPWFDFKPDPAPDKVYDVLALLMKVVKGAKGKEQVVHGELLSAVAALIETGSISSSTGSDESPTSPSGESEEQDDSQSEKSLLPVPGIDLAKGLIDGVPAAMSH